MREMMVPLTGTRPAAAASNLVAPTALATGGVDLSSFRTGGLRPTRIHLRIWGPAATLASVALYGEEGSQIQYLGLLNGGANIPIGGPITGGFIGYGEAVDLAGTFDRLYVVAASGGASHLYDVMALEVQA